MAAGEMKELLAKALEMEEKGHAFYVEMGKKCKNKITQDTFKFLADNELLHLAKIKEFYTALQNEESLPEIDWAQTGEQRHKELDLFGKNIDQLKEKIKRDDQDKQACEFALRLEKDGYDYYAKILQQSSDQKIKRFMEFLLGEEQTHYDGIQKLYTYITDSHNWYMYEEGSFPQGG